VGVNPVAVAHGSKDDALVSETPEFAPKVIELLATIVEAGGEATASHLIETCGLTKPQLKRQLNWMEKQDLVNQVGAWNEVRWIRATSFGRTALRHAEGL